MKLITQTINDISRTIQTGKTPPTKSAHYFDGDINWYTPGDITEKIYLKSSKRYVSKRAITDNKVKLFKKNCILITCIGEIGRVGILKQDSAFNQQITAIELKETIHPTFFAYWCKANRALFERKASKAIVPILNNYNLKKINITHPESLDDQIRIAHLLGKVEALIAQRKQHLQQTDELLKSVFLEMFGDPVRNERGWDKPELKAFGKISTGNTPPRNKPENYEGDFIEWIKTDNITGDAVFVTPATEYLSDVGVKKARTITNGALLVACIAGSVESIGRAALTDRTVSFNQQINAIQPCKDINSLYLYALFKLSRAYIQSHATKGMKKILTKGDFEKITLIKPPFEIQNQFAVIAEKIEGIKSSYQQSLSDLEALYAALSQKAFKGELDLSRIPLPEITEEPTLTTEPDNPMLTAEGKLSLLKNWFYAHCLKHNNPTGSFDHFWQSAQMKMLNYVDEQGESHYFTTEDYDAFKKWVFKEIRAGRFKQSYNEKTTALRLEAVEA